MPPHSPHITKPPYHLTAHTQQGHAMGGSFQPFPSSHHLLTHRQHTTAESSDYEGGKGQLWKGYTPQRRSCIDPPQDSSPPSNPMCANAPYVCAASGCAVDVKSYGNNAVMETAGELEAAASAIHRKDIEQGGRGNTHWFGNREDDNFRLVYSSANGTQEPFSSSLPLSIMREFEEGGREHRWMSSFYSSTSSFHRVDSSTFVVSRPQDNSLYSDVCTPPTALGPPHRAAEKHIERASLPSCDFTTQASLYHTERASAISAHNPVLHTRSCGSPMSTKTLLPSSTHEPSLSTDGISMGSTQSHELHLPDFTGIRTLQKAESESLRVAPPPSRDNSARHSLLQHPPQGGMEGEDEVVRGGGGFSQASNLLAYRGNALSPQPRLHHNFTLENPSSLNRLDSVETSVSGFDAWCIPSSSMHQRLHYGDSPHLSHFCGDSPLHFSHLQGVFPHHSYLHGDSLPRQPHLHGESPPYSPHPPLSRALRTSASSPSFDLKINDIVRDALNGGGRRVSKDSQSSKASEAVDSMSFFPLFTPTRKLSDSHKEYSLPSLHTSASFNSEHSEIPPPPSYAVKDHLHYSNSHLYTNRQASPSRLSSPSLDYFFAREDSSPQTLIPYDDLVMHSNNPLPPSRATQLYPAFDYLPIPSNHSSLHFPSTPPSSILSPSSTYHLSPLPSNILLFSSYVPSPTFSKQLSPPPPHDPSPPLTPRTFQRPSSDSTNLSKEHHPPTYSTCDLAPSSFPPPNLSSFSPPSPNYCRSHLVLPKFPRPFHIPPSTSPRSSYVAPPSARSSRPSLYPSDSSHQQEKQTLNRPPITSQNFSSFSPRSKSCSPPPTSPQTSQYPPIFSPTSSSATPLWPPRKRQVSPLMMSYVFSKNASISRQKTTSSAGSPSSHTHTQDTLPLKLFVAVKLIDFGSARNRSSRYCSYFQSRFYRAPEVLLGCFHDDKCEALGANSSVCVCSCSATFSVVDMWSLGCLLYELFFGVPLFPGCSNYDQLRRIIDFCGAPTDEFLDYSVLADRYFVLRKHHTNVSEEHVAAAQRKWKFMTRTEFEIRNNIVEPLPKDYPGVSSLDELKSLYIRKHETFSNEDLSYKSLLIQRFVDFLKKLLMIEPRHRLTPKEALEHPFLNMMLQSPDSCVYAPFINYSLNSRQRRGSPSSNASLNRGVRSSSFDEVYFSADAVSPERKRVTAKRSKELFW